MKYKLSDYVNLGPFWTAVGCIILILLAVLLRALSVINF